MDRLMVSQGLLLLLCLCFLPGCTGHQANNPAVVVEGWSSDASSQVYRVQPGDTLYSIAWAYGMDYHQLAKHNHLTQPYAIHTGTALQLTRAGSVAESSVAKSSAPKRQTHRKVMKKQAKKTTQSALLAAGRKTGVDWRWPVRGKLLHAYNPKATHKGIDIGADLGAPIKAAGPGVVVYSGSGLRGYGKLLIVKHNASYLSAYAYNKTLLVKEGDRVNVGQVIAKMGSVKAGGPALLHFQIRHHGKPVNPLQYLKG